MSRLSSAKTIFFIAGHSGDIELDSISLGALSKIRFFLLLLKNQGNHVILLYSAPQMNTNNCLQHDILWIDKNISIPRITVPRYKLKRAGRLRNIFDAKYVLECAVEKFGVPAMIWCYNMYAFEMNLARIASQKYHSNIILEYEDSIFARWNLFNPKPIFDWFFSRRALGKVDLAICVNPKLSSWVQKHRITAIIIPGIVSEEILSLPAVLESNLQDLNVGYFGGLSRDKGAEFLIQLIRKSALLESPISYHVTGAGPLSDQFEELAKRYPKTLTFYGVIDRKKYISIVERVSVILNPHLKMPGVFPFKIIESVASGRLVLSSPLHISSTELSWLSEAINFIRLDVDLWHSFLLKLNGSVPASLDNRIKVRSKISLNFTPSSISQSLNLYMNV